MNNKTATEMNSNVLVYTFMLLLIPMVLMNNKILARSGIFHVNIIWTKGLVFAFLITVLIRGLAYDTGMDWLSYYEFLVDARVGRYNAWADHSEWLFKEFVTALASLHLWHCTFFILTSVLLVYSMMKISSLYGKAMPYIILAWYPIMFLLSLNIYRQYISISFVYLFTYFWLNNENKNDRILAIAFLVVAILFHTSAVVAVAFVITTFVLCRKSISVWVWISIIFVVHLATNLFLESFLNITAGFSSIFQIGNTNVYNIRGFSDTMYGTTYTWAFMLVNIACVYYSDKIKDTYQNYNFFHYAAIISYILYPICQQELLSRILLFVRMFVPITLGVMFAHYKKNKGLPYIVICASFITYYFLFFYYLNIMNEDHPYRILLEKY